MGNDLRPWPNVIVIRIEFTADDIARTRIASTESAFTETLFGLGSLRMSRLERIAVPWRRDRDRMTAELAAFLAPSSKVQTDLFTPTGLIAEWGEATDRLLGIPDGTMRGEVEVTHCNGLHAPPWLDGIGEAELGARRRLAGALTRVHRRLVEPYWPGMRVVIEAERARLQRILADGGVDRLLSEFHPQARWQYGALELPAAGNWSKQPLTVRLGGRGIVLVPSVLCPVGPVPFFPYVGDGPAMLFFPVADEHARLGSTLRRDGAALATLLGRTRAAALEEIASSCTTTELARRLGISAATASQHASALRGAGLVASRRDANRVVHTITALGTQLLEVQTKGA